MKKKIVIIGAGLAGLSAALQTSENGNKVVLVSAYPSERAQSVMAEGGINAALNTKGEDDSPEQHYADTIHAACGLADENAVWNLTHAAPELVRWLHRIGVQFNTSGIDEPDLRNFGGQKKKRTAFAQSDTGKQIMTALIDAAREQEENGAVKRLSHHDFVTLLMEDAACCGCVVRDRYSGERLTLSADAVIIATGGMHGLFGDTTGSLFNTGTVTAELFRLGVPMANLEMIQYHPTTVPIGGKRMLISEAARGEGGRLFAMRDGKPWYFMEEKYPELGNLMPRDITAREIWTVRQQSEVFLDMTGLAPEVYEKKLSGLAEDCRVYLGEDIRKEPISVSPGIHYFMGGIRVDAQHRTGVQNLYAAGECCALYHGANRLGGNSLLGALYGGRVAAQTACAEAESASKRAVSIQPSNAVLPCEPQDKAELNRILLHALGVVRSGDTMQDALTQIAGMHGSLPLLGQAVLKSALARNESRGAHWRSDYPQRNDAEFHKTTAAYYDGQTVHISWDAVPERR